MKLSILVPVYNVEKYIRRCLDSVYKQIGSNDEIILVDDGCKDSSGAICDEYQRRFPGQTSVYHKENQGAYPTRNYAMDRCHGDYIWLIDPDDYIQNGAIEKIKETISVLGNPEVVSLAYKRFTDANYQDIENSYSEKQIISGTEYLKGYVPNPYLWAHVYNRRFLLENNIRFSDKLNTQGDWLFNMFVNIKANSIALTDIYAYNYYIDNPTSTLKNPSLAHRIRCVDNSLIAIDEFNDIIKKCSDEKIAGYLQNYQSLNLSGFLYSLFSLNMSSSYVSENVAELKKRGLYPVNLCPYNKKANIFIRFANMYWLFILVCKVRNVIMKELKIVKKA